MARVLCCSLLQASSGHWPGLPDGPSRWQHYLALLPGPAHTASVLLMQRGDLARQLAGSPLRCLALGRLDSMTAQFHHLNRTVLAKFPAVFSPRVYNLQSYLWARATLDMRALWWSSQRHLVPLLELPLLEQQVQAESPPHVNLNGSFGAASPETFQQQAEAKSRQSERMRRIRDRRLREASMLHPDSTGDWVMATTWKAAVGGERIASPPTAALPRHELLLRTGHSPAPSLSQGRPHPADRADGGVDTGFDVSVCPPVLTECHYLELAICDSHPDYAVSGVSQRVWQGRH